MKLWMILPLLLILVLVIVGGYAAYVFLTYSRIEDNLALEPAGNAAQAAQTGREYTIVSWNAGFGAYTADFTFFMDGGKESRARSRESVETCIGGIADTTVSFAPDFALFQEVDTDSTRSWHVDEAQMILDRFAAEGSWDSVFAQNYHSAYLMVPVTQPHGRSNSGILTLSRADIASALRRSLPVASGFKKLLDRTCFLPIWKKNTHRAIMSSAAVISTTTSPAIPAPFSTTAVKRPTAGAIPSPMTQSRRALSNALPTRRG